MSNYEIELQVQGSPSGELTQQVDGEPGGGGVSVREAEAWARGTRAGTAVSSDDPTYHNNSKYYAEQAHDAAESASAAYGTNLLAPTFDASQAYPAGAHVIHDGGYYVLPEGHTAGDTWAETSKTQQTVGGEVTGLKSAKADKDGTHEDLTAGNALYLLSDRGDTDVEPYVFRKTGGAKNGYGREFLRKIVGGTVAWNQLVQNGNFESATGWEGTGSASLSVSDNVATLSFTGTPSSYYGNSIRNALNKGANHVLLLTSMVMASKSGQVETGITNATGSMRIEVTADVWTRSDKIVKRNSTISCNVMFCNGNNYAQYGDGDYIKVKKVNVFDLTQMFGSTIADAIYAMEQATAGSGVAWFRSLFPNSYYAYDAGSLQSVQAKEHRLTGFNQWDEVWEEGAINFTTGAKEANASCIRSKNYISVIPGTVYCYVNKTSSNIRIAYYDENKTYVSHVAVNSVTMPYIFTAPNDARYMMFYYGATAYSYDVCINLSDSSRNGQYEPYESHAYPFDPDLTLRGIPKWDSTNGLYYDGDEYTPDGTVERRYGVVDLGTLSWSKDSTHGYFLCRYNISPNEYIKTPSANSYMANLVCGKYVANTAHSIMYESGLGVGVTADGYIVINDTNYSDAATFKTAMSGVYLVYELATPITEQADPFRELQISAHGGTEEFVDAGATASTPTRDVSVPVGTETFYPVDIWHLIDELTALVLEN